MIGFAVRLVRLLPASFRSQFGAEIVDQLRRDHARAHGRGRVHGHVFALFAMLDILRNVLAERWSPTWRQLDRSAEIHGGNMRAWGGWTNDMRHAMRAMRRSPGFTAVTSLTLALGIGASAAIFSVVYGVLLKPLPFDESDRLVSLSHFGSLEFAPTLNHGPATYFAALDHQHVFEGVGVWEQNDVTITGGGDPENVSALTVTHTTLPLLRVQPALGRLFIDEDDVPGAPMRVILTHGYWQRRFGGATDVIGRSMQVDGTPAEIIGVLPASFRFLHERPEVLLPQRLDRADALYIQFDFQVLGRLKPGATIAQANEDMAAWLERLPPVFAQLELRPYIRPLVKHATGDVERVLWVLMAAVVIVMLVACANVANLYLVRAESRQIEFAMRAALGASRGRQVRTLLSESVSMSLVSGTVGVLLAYMTIGLLRRIAPAELPRVDEIGMDTTVLLFTLAISLSSGVLLGLVAVLRLGRAGPASRREAGRRTSGSRERHRTRSTLVVAQVALSLTLLILSGLMVRTFVALRSVEPGFTQPGQVQTFRVAVPEAMIPEPARFAATIEGITERLTNLPGVESVGFASAITMEGEDNGNPVLVEGFPVERPPLRRYRSAGPAYFETMGNPVIAGRGITWDDIHRQRPVVVISRALASNYWPEPAQAVGRRMRGSSDAPWHEIVGVVGDERDDGLSEPPTPIIYWPLANESYDRRSIVFAVRSSRAGTAPFIRELHQAVWSVNSNLPLAAVQTLDRIQARSMARTSFAMVMLAIAASIALLLGTVGIYGVVAYIATQRTREIGIRMALGARTEHVRTMFLRYGMRLTALGITLGIGMALLLTNVISNLLFGVTPNDAMTYVAVSGMLIIVALLATYLPARRASLVDPAVALRADG